MIRFVFRWAFRIFLVALVLFVAAVLLRDQIFKSAAVRNIRSQTGLEAKIGKLETGLLTPTITIENFVLYNSPEFGGGPFLKIPELHVEYDPHMFTGGKPHFKLIRLNVSEFNVIENQAGQTNLFILLGSFQTIPIPKGLPPATLPGRTSPTNQPSIVDTLNLTVGHARFTSLKNSRINQDFNVGLTNEIIQNVRSPEDLYPVLMKVVLRNGISYFWNPAPSSKARAR